MPTKKLKFIRNLLVLQLLVICLMLIISESYKNYDRRGVIERLLGG